MLHSEDALHSDLVRTLLIRRSYEIRTRAYSAASLRGDADADADADADTDADPDADADAVTELDTA
jgi:hypothetical protein